ncbi:hypothetical protein ACJX0J_006337, partial [Zea mays]
LDLTTITKQRRDNIAWRYLLLYPDKLVVFGGKKRRMMNLKKASLEDTDLFYSNFMIFWLTFVFLTELTTEVKELESFLAEKDSKVKNLEELKNKEINEFDEPEVKVIDLLHKSGMTIFFAFMFLFRIFSYYEASEAFLYAININE